MSIALRADRLLNILNSFVTPIFNTIYSVADAFIFTTIKDISNLPTSLAIGAEFGFRTGAPIDGWKLEELIERSFAGVNYDPLLLTDASGNQSLAFTDSPLAVARHKLKQDYSGDAPMYMKLIYTIEGIVTGGKSWLKHASPFTRVMTPFMAMFGAGIALNGFMNLIDTDPNIHYSGVGLCSAPDHASAANPDSCSTFAQGDQVYTSASHGYYNPADYVPNAAMEGTNYTNSEWVKFTPGNACTIEPKTNLGIPEIYTMEAKGMTWYRVNCGYEAGTGREAIGWVPVNSLEKVACALQPTIPASTIILPTDTPIPTLPPFVSVNYTVAQDDTLNDMFFGQGNSSNTCIDEALQTMFGGNDNAAFNRFALSIATTHHFAPDTLPLGIVLKFNVPSEYLNCFSQN